MREKKELGTKKTKRQLRNTTLLSFLEEEGNQASQLLLNQINVKQSLWLNRPRKMSLGQRRISGKLLPVSGNYNL